MTKPFSPELPHIAHGYYWCDYCNAETYCVPKKRDKPLIVGKTAIDNFSANYKLVCLTCKN